MSSRPDTADWQREASIPISWTVTNNGADTGNVPIIDNVYIGFDQALDTSQHSTWDQ